ncbi:hypothetical protein [Streptomyces sp. bgisy126]|uniref:hypothetical protein n=1 Tax=unclassified Streptomyces TaxID=2593676 RepID=UPI003EBA665A
MGLVCAGLGLAVAARVNTVVMPATFGGGAAGSLAGTWLYAAHGRPRCSRRGRASPSADSSR